MTTTTTTRPDYHVVYHTAYIICFKATGSTPERQNARTPEHQNTRTPEHQNTRTPEHQNTRTPKHQNTRTPEHKIHFFVIKYWDRAQTGCAFTIKTSHGRSNHAKISGFGLWNEALGQFEGFS
jgi:hypothetical protein